MNTDDDKSSGPVPVDPWIEAYKPGIDMSIVRHNLQLTISERIDNLQSLMQSIEEMQEVGRRARARQDEQG